MAVFEPTPTPGSSFVEDNGRGGISFGQCAKETWFPRGGRRSSAARVLTLGRCGCQFQHLLYKHVERAPPWPVLARDRGDGGVDLSPLDSLGEGVEREGE